MYKDIQHVLYDYNNGHLKSTMFRI